MADEKVYIETLPHDYCGLDLGLPLDSDVRKTLEGFHKVEMLRLLDEGQARLDEGEDVNSPSNFAPAGPQLPIVQNAINDSRVEQDLADAIGDEAVTGEVEVADDYDEWSREELYAEAKEERGLTGLSKADKPTLIEVLRKYDREHPEE